MATTPSPNQPATTKNPASNLVAPNLKGLNPKLIATFWKLKRENSKWVRDQTAPFFLCGLRDTNLEVALNWQSPFENSGTETQAPTLAAMLQTGALSPLINATVGSDSAIGGKANDMIRQFEGRTGITKLNSTQVFNGMQPIKITTTLVLRAWADPMAEVERPLATIFDWLLPQKLAEDGSVVARAAETARGDMGAVEAMMPSLAPVPVSFLYKDRVFKELVIESMGIPLDSPVDAKGHFVQLALPVTLCSITAIDRHDWKAQGPI